MLTSKSDVCFDPYDVEIGADPYPVFQRLREEAPLYYNEEHDFYALSRYEDNAQALLNPKVFSSSRGDILELIKANMEFPPGTFIFEDDPVHQVHRSVLSRVFTPKRMLALEPQMREFCARSLDPLVGGDRFDFVADLGAQMPMRVIGMLLGIPEGSYTSVQEGGDDWFNTEPGQKMTEAVPRVDELEVYLDWRIANPCDDLTTQLLTTEFEDETGTVRCLSRDEALSYINLLAIAGNETTGRLIGWTGKLLSDHPGQRHALVEDPSLIPNAIEEVLRFQPPGPFLARYMLQDVEIHGQTVPAGSAILLIIGSANRDDRRFPDGDSFDIRRETSGHLTFTQGVHFCLGTALARLEGRVALEEVLKRFPDWEVDSENARLAVTSTVRGYESLPVRVTA
jgi:cytochrome P450